MVEMCEHYSSGENLLLSFWGGKENDFLANDFGSRTHAQAMRVARPRIVCHMFMAIYPMKMVDGKISHGIHFNLNMDSTHPDLNQDFRKSFKTS